MTKQELIDEVMDNFDFGKVANVMLALNWVWATTKYEVPEEAEIRKHARTLLTLTYENAIKVGRGYTVGTGGFEANYDIDHKMLSLKFVASSWEAGGEF
jgi:hypothetical protein